jgi:hypothetical protein
LTGHQNYSFFTSWKFSIECWFRSISLYDDVRMTPLCQYLWGRSTQAVRQNQLPGMAKILCARQRPTTYGTLPQAPKRSSVNLMSNNMLPMERDSYFYILLDGRYYRALVAYLLSCSKIRGH